MLKSNGPSPSAAPPSDVDPSIQRNARFGLVLFAIYVVLYAGFMGLSAFAIQMMAKPVLGGVNLAVVYGFGLIVGAIVLALVYLALCCGGTDKQEDAR